jgi:hypothetical protein
MLEFTTAFVCIDRNYPPGCFNQCRLPLRSKSLIASVILAKPSTDVRTTVLPRAQLLDRHLHAGSVKRRHQFGIELSSDILARSGITCLTEFFAESLPSVRLSGLT